MRAALLAAGLAAGLVAACTGPAPLSHEQGPVIAIASDLPTSGVDGVGNGQPLRAAIDLAIQDRGSIHGYRLVHQPFDDALIGIHDFMKGEQNIRIMVGRPQILGVIGPYNSDVAQTEIPVANAAGLVMISPSNTLGCLTSLPDSCTSRPSSLNSYFRIAAPDSTQGSAAGAFAVRKLKLTRIAVLTDGLVLGSLLADRFTAAFEANGGTVVFRGSYPFNLNDYTPLLVQARNAGAEAIFVGGFGFSGACRLRAGMADVFPAGTYMLAGDQISDLNCIRDAGAAANDHLLAMISDSQPSLDSKVFKEFRAHGIKPTTYAFSAYDCALIVIDAIGRAIQANGGKLPTRRQVLDAVAATHGFVGATNTFSFQPNGDAVAPDVSVYRVVNGAWTFWQNAT